MSKKSRERRKRAQASSTETTEPELPPSSEEAGEGPSAPQGISKAAKRRAQKKRTLDRRRSAREAAAAEAALKAGAISASGAAAKPTPPASIPHPVPRPLAFEAAEEDHCETAPEAYAHIASVLHQIATGIGVEPARLRIYDPYYCNGAVVRHLGALGFPSVHNENEDFYAVLDAGRVPEHDVVVTNPPYSGTHPQRLLRFLADNGKPWLALMPNWVYAKDYYAPALQGVPTFYLVPRKRYYYWTPRGRRADVSSGGAKAKTHGHTNAALGARTAPFISFWYGGLLPAISAASLAAPEGCELCWQTQHLPQSVLADTDPRRRDAWRGQGQAHGMRELGLIGHKNRT